MEQISNEIRVRYSDRSMNKILDAVRADEGTFTRHFSQNEEFFLKLDGEYEVPRIPIHHDVRQPDPGPEYIAQLIGVLQQVTHLAPQVFRGLSWFFDPAEKLRPCFFSVSSIDESLYLYLMRLDLAAKPSECTIVERGTNDMTPRYRSRTLFLENTIIPLSEVVMDDGRVSAFRILQTISQTWIGESGRGYFQQGIWMDVDLTKFFSRLFLPAGSRVYPFYPFQCRYKTACQSVIDLSPNGRAAALPLLHRALQYLLPVMEDIQAAMRTAGFSEELPCFRELKAGVPQEWYEPWARLRVEAYLNESGMKEFAIDD